MPILTKSRDRQSLDRAVKQQSRTIGQLRKADDNLGVWAGATFTSIISAD